MSIAKMSAAKRSRIVELVMTTRLSHRDIAKRTKVSPSTVSSIVVADGLVRPPEPFVEEATDPVDRQRQADEVRREKQAYVEALREQSFREYLQKLVKENVNPVPPVQRHRARPAPTKATKRFPLLVFTDWHFEELVQAEGTLGLNTYDIPTACRRVHRVARVVMDWKRDVESAGRFHVPELVVLLNGDMITGSLHGLERHSDAPNVVRAAFACGDLIAAAIADLAAVFPKVRVVGVPGNHGRLPDDRKVPTKDPTRSWDYVAYQVARRRLSSNPNVGWHTFDAYGILFEVGGHLCYAAHGNFIPKTTWASSGTASGGSRPTWRATCRPPANTSSTASSGTGTSPRRPSSPGWRRSSRPA